MLGNFTYCNPTKLYFGEQSLEGLHKELPKYGDRVVLIYGGGSIKRNGIYDAVRAILDQEGKQVAEIAGVMPNPTLAKLYEGIGVARAHQADLLLAVGGGSAVGKLIPMKLIFKMQHAAALKDKHGCSSLRYYSNYQPDYLYVTIQKEWCEEITDIEFAGETLMASKHAHEVLTWVYGDYMKLPPEAERVPAHSTIDIQVFDEEA